MKFKPLGTNVIIKPNKIETKTESGFILHEKDVDGLPTGVIVFIGPEVKGVDVGNTVIYNNNRAVALEYDTDKNLKGEMVCCSDIHAIATRG